MSFTLFELGYLTSYNILMQVVRESNHRRAGTDKVRTRDRFGKLLVKIPWLQIQAAYIAKLIILSVILYCQGRCLFMCHIAHLRDLNAAGTARRSSLVTLHNQYKGNPLVSRHG